MKIIKGEFNDTGINEIDVNFVVNKWNHLWMLSEWSRDNSWRIIKYVRKDSQITQVKITISWQQANEIVKKLNLKRKSSMFKSGFSWRAEKDVEYLDKWRREK